MLVLFNSIEPEWGIEEASTRAWTWQKAAKEASPAGPDLLLPRASELKDAAPRCPAHSAIPISTKLRIDWEQSNKSADIEKKRSRENFWSWKKNSIKKKRRTEESKSVRSVFRNTSAPRSKNFMSIKRYKPWSSAQKKLREGREKWGHNRKNGWGCNEMKKMYVLTICYLTFILNYRKHFLEVIVKWKLKKSSKPSSDSMSK